VVAIAELHIDDRRIFVYSVLIGFSGRLPNVFVVLLRRCPEMEHHFTAAARDFDSCVAEVCYLSNDKRVPRYRSVSSTHLCPGIEPFGKMSNGISFRDVHSFNCRAIIRYVWSSVYE
jgi:hypothetical protein